MKKKEKEKGRDIIHGVGRRSHSHGAGSVNFARDSRVATSEQPTGLLHVTFASPPTSGEATNSPAWPCPCFRLPFSLLGDPGLAATEETDEAASLSLERRPVSSVPPHQGRTTSPPT